MGTLTLPFLPTVDTTADLAIGTALVWTRDPRKSKAGKNSQTDVFAARSPIAGHPDAQLDVIYPLAYDGEEGKLTVRGIYPLQYVDGTGALTRPNLTSSLYIAVPQNVEMTSAQLRDHVLQFLADCFVGLGGALASAKPATSFFESVLYSSVLKG